MIYIYRVTVYDKILKVSIVCNTDRRGSINQLYENENKFIELLNEILPNAQFKVINIIISQTLILSTQLTIN